MAHTKANYLTICVDCSVIEGNPGIGEYQGIDIETKEVLFIYKFKNKVTNNIAEWTAICHACNYLIENGIEGKIYSDSKIAINWFNNLTVKTNMKTHYPELWSNELEGIISFNLEYIIENKLILPKIEFWNKKLTGIENPADYGRK